MESRVLIVTNAAWNHYNFRRPLARALKARGLRPILVSPEDSYARLLLAEGFEWIPLEMSRKGINPVAELLTLLRFIRCYAQTGPVAAHHFTIKCVLYGTIAARLCRVRAIVNGITGVGHVFTSSSLAMRLLRPLVVLLYRMVLAGRGVRVIFQNADDRDELARLGVASARRSTLIRSSGVDVTRFQPQPNPANGSGSSAPPIVLFASRLLRDKGIVEFIEAARILSRNGVPARFRVAGDLDSGNPSSVTAETLAEWKSSGVAEFVGHVSDIKSVLLDASIVVLPSYREGVPRILLEAAAMGLAVVATDVPGCREAVRDGENGYLVPVRDPAALAAAIERLTRDPALRERMGRAGRELVVREFSEELVVRKTMEVYDSLLTPTP